MRKVAKDVPVTLIDLDPENPRIRAAIERQGIEHPSEDQLSFHLSAAGLPTAYRGLMPTSGLTRKSTGGPRSCPRTFSTDACTEP